MPARDRVAWPEPVEPAEEEGWLREPDQWLLRWRPGRMPAAELVGLSSERSGDGLLNAGGHAGGQLLGHLSRPGGWLGRGASLFILFWFRHLFGRNFGKRWKREVGLVTFERAIEGVGVGE